MNTPCTLPTEIWINILSQITDMNELQALIKEIPDFRSLTDLFISIIAFRPEEGRFKKSKQKDRISSSVYTVTLPRDSKDLKVIELIELKEQLDDILIKVRKNLFHKHLVLEFCYKDEFTYKRFHTVYRIVSEVFLNKKEASFVSVIEEIDHEEGC